MAALVRIDAAWLATGRTGTALARVMKLHRMPSSPCTCCRREVVLTKSFTSSPLALRVCVVLRPCAFNVDAAPLHLSWRSAATETRPVRCRSAVGRCRCTPVSCFQIQPLAISGDGDPACAAALPLAMFSRDVRPWQVKLFSERADEPHDFYAVCMREQGFEHGHRRLRMFSIRSRVSCSVSVLPTSLKASSRARSGADTSSSALPPGRG